ncbi:MAG: hypothetical protein ACKO9A_25215 [Alphaproteobacteria bacterium]
MIPEEYDATQQRDSAFFAERLKAWVKLGHDVWIGHGVSVLAGVAMGDCGYWARY